MLELVEASSRRMGQDLDPGLREVFQDLSVNLVVDTGGGNTLTINAEVYLLEM